MGRQASGRHAKDRPMTVLSLFRHPTENTGIVLDDIICMVLYNMIYSILYSIICINLYSMLHTIIYNIVYILLFTMVYIIIHNMLYIVIYIVIHSMHYIMLYHLRYTGRTGMPRLMKVPSMYNTMEMGTFPGPISSCAIWNATEPLASHARMRSPFSSL